jgi:hypothetical protein
LAIKGRLIGSEKAACRAQTCGNTEKQKNRKTEQQILAGISNRSASDPT